MKKVLLAAMLVPVAFGLAGCMDMGPPTTVLPLGNNKYQAITSTDSQSDAYQASLKHAQDTCAKQGQQVVVIKSDYKYTGPNQQQKEEEGAIGAVAGLLSHGQQGNDTDNNEDNKVTLTFKCS